MVKKKQQKKRLYSTFFQTTNNQYKLYRYLYLRLHQKFIKASLTARPPWNSNNPSRVKLDILEVSLITEAIIYEWQFAK